MKPSELAEEYAKIYWDENTASCRENVKIDYIAGFEKAVELCLEILDTELGDNHYSVTEKIKALSERESGK